MSLKSLSVLCGVVLLASVGCGDSGTGGSGGGSAGGNTGGSPGTGGNPGTGGSPDGGSPGTGGSPDGGSPGTGGAGGAGNAFDMSFNGSGFNPHNKQTLYVQVRDAADAVVASDMVVVAGGTFSFTFTGIDAEGGNVDYYADVNGDNACTNAGEPDHVWREPIPANHALVVTHNTNFSQAACDGF